MLLVRETEMKKTVSKGAMIAILGAIGVGLAKAKSKTGSSSKELLAFRPSQWLEANKNLKMNGSQWIGVLKKKFPSKDELFMMEPVFQELDRSKMSQFTGYQVYKLCRGMNVPQEVIVRSDIRPVKTETQIKYLQLKSEMEYLINNSVGFDLLRMELRDRLLNVESFNLVDQVVDFAENNEERQELSHWVSTNQELFFDLLDKGALLRFYEMIGDSEYETYKEYKEDLGSLFEFEVFSDSGDAIDLDMFYEQQFSEQQSSEQQSSEQQSSEQEDIIPEYVDIGASYANKSLDIGVQFNILFNVKVDSRYKGETFGGRHFREGTRNVFHVRGEILKEENLLIIEEIQSDWYQRKLGRENPVFLNGSERWAMSSIYAGIQLAYDLGLEYVLFVDPETESNIQGHGYIREGIQYWYGKFIPKMVSKICKTWGIQVLGADKLGSNQATRNIISPYGIRIEGKLLDYLGRHRLSAYGPIRQQGFLR
jgi:hypothetical protein